MTAIEPHIKKLAAIAYGEASGLNDADEIAGIAYAVANRARAWGNKTIEELLAADPNYTYAVKDGNARYGKLIHAADEEIAKDPTMSLAVEGAKNAMQKKGGDPSGGAYWWDGVDFKTNYKKHPKVRDGFHFGNTAHNIFSVEESAVDVTIYWKVKNKKTGLVVNSKVRGSYKYVWISTASHGKTIFWTHDPEYIAATGGKEFR